MSDASTDDAPTVVVVPMQRGADVLARRKILCRHARLTKAGRPIVCRPSRGEIEGTVLLRQGRGTDGKIIYSTREAAEAAARELESLGARPLRSYLCGRSRGGHFHLTTDTAARAAHPIRRGRDGAVLIPRQRIPA